MTRQAPARSLQRSLTQLLCVWVQAGLLLSSAAQAAPKARATAGLSELPSHCELLQVVRRSFGHGVASHNPLSLDPDHQQGRQVFVSLSNGQQLEIAEDTGESLFFSNFDVAHTVELCSASSGTTWPYTIADRTTGSFSEARPLSLPGHGTAVPAGGKGPHP